MGRWKRSDFSSLSFYGSPQEQYVGVFQIHIWTHWLGVGICDKQPGAAASQYLHDYKRFDCRPGLLQIFLLMLPSIVPYISSEKIFCQLTTKMIELI
jgi:hypothetical protein